ncbi:hypothetical protein BDP55DRAFT_698645 [Colletotrichum godetiae]|uniref:Short chain type dehydrogenase n=1 Tax=Colletotrichum godetiae TaxID=1209918 RepID=A0AAJ0A8G2_9PEZI|nr:uncharacterized protein BDP55DRAFT_698645 [Colletotrichum godetiae]KAK1657959.1 hypothetical protein BDP55DRAFT_698645 [Colletotrichum godetiae]
MAANQSLAGKIAVVSGSCSGIGHAIAKELSARGSHAVINYPHASLAEEAAAVAATLITPGIAIEANMSTVDGPKRLIESVVEVYGHIDILVNNAAIAINLPFEEQTLDHWDSLVNLNGRGTFLLTQQALSRAAPPLQTIYAGTKGMVDSFTRVWAKELPPKYGCTVNAVSPGPTATQGFLSAGDEAMKVLGPTIEATPAEKRLGQPEEIADAVAFLCEERSRWVNGEHMFVNGGLYMD